MLNFSQPHASPNIIPHYMSDGSELFPYLWRHFLRHQPVRDWLMRRPPYHSTTITPAHVAQGVAFCCNFDTPEIWSDMASSFEMGEMFIPDHRYRQFMCGSVVAATPFHKHLICALGPAATRHYTALPSYRTRVRRMVVDLVSSRSINLFEFSWMEDGMLIVTAKILVPPPPGSLKATAGCNGAFALFDNVVPAGDLPAAPRSFVSFVEAPRCPTCYQQGALGCCCRNALPSSEAQSCSIWPPAFEIDKHDSAVHTMTNVCAKLACIQRVAHVKVTAHVVTPQTFLRDNGLPWRTYKLGPSRFTVKAVMFRPSTPFEMDTLRQVADKWRLLRSSTLRYLSTRSDEDALGVEDDALKQNASLDLSSVPTSQYSHEQNDADLCIPMLSGATSTFVSEMLKAARATSPMDVVAPTYSPEQISEVRTCPTCGRSKEALLDGNELGMCSCDLFSVLSERTGSLESLSPTLDGCKDSERENAKGLKRPTCTLCGKTFSQQGSLNRHLKNIHEEKKIPCQYCNMSFGQMFDLRVSCAVDGIAVGRFFAQRKEWLLTVVMCFSFGVL